MHLLIPSHYFAQFPIQIITDLQFIFHSIVNRLAISICVIEDSHEHGHQVHVNKYHEREEENWAQYSIGTLQLTEVEVPKQQGQQGLDGTEEAAVGPKESTKDEIRSLGIGHEDNAEHDHEELQISDRSAESGGQQGNALVEA